VEQALHFTGPGMQAYRAAGLVFLAVFFWSLGCRRDAAPVAAGTRPVRHDGPPATTAPGGPPAPAEPWVPAEYKEGGRQWRDAGVYVDGRPVGVLWFGELPRRLEPVWRERESVIAVRPGRPPQTRRFRERRYRLVDYLEAVGIDPRRIRSLHLHGGKDKVAVISRRELLRVRDQLLFWFGSETSGKPLMLWPHDLRTNSEFDQLRGVAVYIHRRPPELGPDGALRLGGVPVDGIPYFGPPLRGGVRIYKDDRLVTVFKRNQADDLAAVRRELPDGEQRYSLFALLAARGIATDDVAAAEVVHDERRVYRLDRRALETLDFAASAQASGHILLGPERRTAEVLMLYTRPLTDRRLTAWLYPEEFPQEGESVRR
jgi:hypothetical protein